MMHKKSESNCFKQTFSERRSKSGAQRAPLAIFIDERELSAASDFLWRARVERRSFFDERTIALVASKDHISLEISTIQKWNERTF